MKKKINLIILLPLIMAFQCEEEFLESNLKYNIFKVKISAEYSFSLNDTIWLNGKISNKVFDLKLNDSVIAEKPRSDVFSIYKFIKPTGITNCEDAINKFDLIFKTGQYSNLPKCNNAKLNVVPEIDNNNLFYTYRLGLIPKTKGDFVISWEDGVIENLERNVFIINNYLILNHPNQIGFNSCNNVSWRYFNESEKEYYFRIE